MALKVITQPTIEPVTILEAKAHLRIDTTDEDTLITSLITVAREYCENFQNRAYLTQTLELTLDEFPDVPLDLLRPPLQSVTSITYKDSAGNSATIATTDYIIDADSEPGRITLADGKSWPNVILFPIGSVKIRYIAGNTDAIKVPARVKQAMLLLIGHWYENREATDTGTLKQVPLAVDTLLWQDRLVVL